MKRFIAVLSVILFPLFLYSNLDLDELCEKVSTIVVEVQGMEKSTWFNHSTTSYSIHGFFLNPDGYVVTCKSLLENLENLKVMWTDKNERPYCLDATLILEHPTRDVALLKVDHPNGEPFPHCPLKFDPIKLKSWVFLSNINYYKQENYPRVGKVLKFTSHKENIHNVMLSISSVNGGIGCPVFDLNGSIIGVQVNYYVNKDLICCLPIFHLKKWIHEELPEPLRHQI